MTRSSRPPTGAARPLLLAVLGLAVVLACGSLWYLATSDALDDLVPSGDDGSLVDDQGNAVGPGLPPRQGGRAKSGRADTDDGDDDDPDNGIIELGGSRDDEIAGPVFTVDDESLREVFKARIWEEVRRQIDVLQSEKKTIPDDVLQAMVAMLKADDTRIDAVLCLGMVTDDRTGLILAQLATDPSADAGTRAAALNALSVSGQAMGLSLVRTLVEGDASAGVDETVQRRAFLALAAMGGDGIGVLMAALDRHAGDDLADAIVTALAKARGGDETLAAALRSARDGADLGRMDTILRIGMQAGAKSGPELRAEVRRIIEGRATLGSLDEEARLRIVGSALSVGAAMGGEAFPSVVRTALDATGAERGMALYALRQATGDDAATTMLDALPPSLWAAAEPSTRMAFTTALGATTSRRATPLLVKGLADTDINVRNASAAALGQIRDPDSVLPMLDQLELSLADFDYSRTLVDAIGRTCSKLAEKRLQALLEREFGNRENLSSYIRRALYRIESGNPDATLLK